MSALHYRLTTADGEQSVLTLDTDAPDVVLAALRATGTLEQINDEEHSAFVSDFNSTPGLRGRVHTCDVCGASGEWGEGWEWYGSVLDMEACTLVKTCDGCTLSDEAASKMVNEKRTAKYGDAKTSTLRQYA